jgi:hypothetical protein
MQRMVLVALGIACLVPRPAQSQSIGLFLDPGGAVCAAEVGPTPRIDIHVVAFVGGNVPRFSAAQFRILAAPGGWTERDVLWVFNSAVSLGFGNPLFPSEFDETPGCIVTFHDWCRGDGEPAGDANPIAIGRIVVLGAPTPPNTILRVWPYALTPNDPPCAFMIPCGPSLNPVCVEGGSAVLNPTYTPRCTGVAVTSETWTGIKQLYRGD